MSNKTFNGIAKLEGVRSPSTDQVLKGWTGSGKAKRKGSRKGAKEQREKQRVCLVSGRKGVNRTAGRAHQGPLSYFRKSVRT